ncbi:hypothetical protein HRbin29_01935 [bacterium HR29]|nr:hypothetical protein HRbin29_01935 [bacterium HR29]
MAYTDKSLICADCGATFAFTAGEQEFHASKGFTNEPKRCPTCRRARRGESSGGHRSQRTTYSAVCASCGREAQLPFEPRGDRPVYCSDCYRPSSPRPSFGTQRGGGRGRRW